MNLFAKRWEFWLALLGVILLALGAHWIGQGELPRHDEVLQIAACRTPATILDPPGGLAPAGTVIVFHGLSASRRLMLYLGEDFAAHGIRVYLVDFPGHGDSTDAFSFAKAEDCAQQSVQFIARRDSLPPAKTIALGHSMGGAIAIRMADQVPLAATIAISPAPMVLPRRMPANLLVFSAQFDVWALARQAAALEEAGGGERTRPNDFAENRAISLVHVPLATHTSMLDDHRVVHSSELWAMRALFPKVDEKTLALNLDLGTYGAYARGKWRLAGSVFGMAGIGFMFPLVAGLAAKLVATDASDALPPEYVGVPYQMASAQVGLAALAAVLLLVLGVPFRFIHMYSADYLASVIFIVAAPVLFINRDAARRICHTTPPQLALAIALGLVAVLATSAWFNWHMADLWLNAPRWLRFVELLPFSWALCFAEEVLLGPLDARKMRASRYATFLLLRLEIWLACLLAFFVLASGQILLPILFLQLAVFSVAQRLAADTLLRRGASPAAAALFGAILAAWFVAAVFPIT